jgi:hypothetical protein
MGVMVRDCEPGRLADLAVVRLPLVIVVSHEVYDRDAEELELLARDVRAILLPVREDESARDLDAALVGAVRAATHRREERPASGRYSLLPGEIVALPSPVTDPAPGPTSGIHPSVALELDLDEPVTMGETPKPPAQPAYVPPRVAQR